MVLGIQSKERGQFLKGCFGAGMYLLPQYSGSNLIHFSIRWLGAQGLASWMWQPMQRLQEDCTKCLPINIAFIEMGTLGKAEKKSEFSFYSNIMAFTLVDWHYCLKQRRFVAPKLSGKLPSIGVCPREMSLDRFCSLMFFPSIHWRPLD